MNRLTADIKLIARICKGDREAMEWLNAWGGYCHAIDDIIDGDRKGSEALLATFASAIDLYSHPFYLRNLACLAQVARNVTSTYADTVAWEASGEEWQRQWADHHRHCSSDMAQAVAMICGGYNHARAIMPELRSMAYYEHHNQDGTSH
jgi:hypothetical protein